MRNLLVILCLISSLPAQAADYFDKKYELQLMPSIGYSNFNGLTAGLGANLLIPLSDRWQWKVSGFYELSKRTSTRELSLGPVYNLSEDWSRAFFVGAGVGLRDYSDVRSPALVYGYLEAGKRFALNKEGTITWIPSVRLESNGANSIQLGILPATFGWSF